MGKNYSYFSSLLRGILNAIYRLAYSPMLYSFMGGGEGWLDERSGGGGG